ncbi:hypothetical protein ScalyP_jg9604 [Parmales sp. scaly parma]|nr:hypothetical protein ScalyP_jg9604 [Parmales sp. scaly parma]
MSIASGFVNTPKAVYRSQTHASSTTPSSTTTKTFSSPPSNPEPFLQTPFVKKFLSKHMFKNAVNDLFVDTYVGTQSIVPITSVKSKFTVTGYVMSLVAKHGKAMFPVVSVGILASIIIVAKLNDRWIAARRLRERDEEIEMYGEFLDPDATPLDPTELSFEADDVDDRNDAVGKAGDAGAGGNGGGKGGGKDGNDDDELFG